MMIRSYAFTVCLVFICVTSCQVDQKPDGLPWQEINSLLENIHADDRFHGCVVIGNQDTVYCQKAIGLANRSWDIPMTLDVRFDIASLNKSFVAALVLLAVEEGKLRLEDRLSDVLSHYTAAANFDSQITLHQMLCHTSGLPDYDRVSEDLSAHGFARFKRLHFDNEAYVTFISELKPVASSGERFYYSNFAYHLLCILLEDTYQTSFAEILQEKITKPLGMENTFSTTSNKAVFPRVAEGYNYIESGAHWERNNFIDLTLGRRIFSTASDLYRWAQAMNDDRLLNKHSRSIMQQNHLSNIGADFSYGYGWVVYGKKEKYRMGDLGIDKPYLIHGGSTEGYKAMLVIINEGEHILTLLSNVGNRTNEMELTKAIIQILDNRIQ